VVVLPTNRPFTTGTDGSVVRKFLNGHMRILALRAIHAYQRYVSPHKGFCCAYRSITGRLSCSNFSARAIEKTGIIAGICLTFRRMRRCSSVYAEFHSSVHRTTRLGEHLNHQSGHCDLPIEGCASDALSQADCATCVPSECYIWTPKRKEKKPDERLSDGLQR
jgi:uncharacterized protein